VSSMHAACCQEDHKDECGYYQEGQVKKGEGESIWQKDSHQDWLKKAYALADLMEMSLNEMYTHFGKALTVINKSFPDAHMKAMGGLILLKEAEPYMALFKKSTELNYNLD